MWSLSAPRRPNVPGLRFIMQGEKETKTVYSKKQVPRRASRGENFKKAEKNKLSDKVLLYSSPRQGVFSHARSGCFACSLCPDVRERRQGGTVPEP